MAQINQYGVSALPAVLVADAQYYVLRDNAIDHFIVNTGGTIAYPVTVHPLVFEQASVTTLAGAANINQNVWTQAVTFPYNGYYIATLGFSWNIDSIVDNFRAYVSLAGAAIDSNLAPNPSGQFQILNKRMRNSGNTDSGAIPATGSGNQENFTKQFIIGNKTAGTTESLSLGMGANLIGINKSMWNITLKIELIKN